MKTYEDFGYTDHTQSLKKVKFTKYKIVVPSEKDKKELQEGFRYIHDYIDNEENYVVVNQLMHTYLDEPDLIVVNKELYKNI